MLNTQGLNGTPIVSDDSRQRSVLTREQAEKIVNIAGIRTGDSVRYAGVPDRMIEAAVKGLGARFIADRPTPWPVVVRNRADVALCFLCGDGRRDTIQSLRILRRYLRPGGRMVMWATPDKEHPASSFRNTLQKMAGNAGFTSMIVGQLPRGNKGGTIVATGILRG